MISDQARRSVEQIFIKAAKARLILDSGDFCMSRHWAGTRPVKCRKRTSSS